MFFAAISDKDDRLKVERLYYMYRKLMYKEAFSILQDKHLAKDVISESFIRIINNLHKIDENDCPRTRNFLVIICRNVAKDIYRKRHSESIIGITDDTESELISDNNPSDIVIGKESAKRLAECISQLDPKYRDIFILRRAYNMSREDIAKTVGISEEAVKKRLQRAKAMILKEYSKEQIK